MASQPAGPDPVHPRLRPGVCHASGPVGGRVERRPSPRRRRRAAPHLAARRSPR
jgi:hypothetical protein